MLAAVSVLASEVRPVAGGMLIRTPGVRLAVSEAVWHPAADRLAEVVAWCRAAYLSPAVVAAPDDALDDALLAARWTPSFGIALDDVRDPAAGDAGPRPETTLDQLGWDGAAEIAHQIADAYGLPGDQNALATLLASVAADDARVRLIVDVGDGEDARASCVIVEDEAYALTLLHAGPAERAIGRALAAARGLGKRTGQARVCAWNAPEAILRRWEPER